MPRNVAFDKQDADTIIGSGNISGLEGNDDVLGSARVGCALRQRRERLAPRRCRKRCIDGGKDNDATVGNAGADLEFGAAGADTMFGNQDERHAVRWPGCGRWRNGCERPRRRLRRRYLFGTSGNETLLGNENNDLVDAGGGTDTVFGGKGNDSVNGDAGDDLLIGGEGNNAIHGGSGIDHAAWAGTATGVYDAVLGAVIVTHGGGSDTVYNDVEQLVWGGVSTRSLVHSGSRHAGLQQRGILLHGAAGRAPQRRWKPAIRRRHDAAERLQRHPDHHQRRLGVQRGGSGLVLDPALPDGGAADHPRFVVVRRHRWTSSTTWRPARKARRTAATATTSIGPPPTTIRVSATRPWRTC